MQLPETHFCTPGQTVPQALQLFESAEVLVQAPPQRVVPVGQPPQDEPTQVWRAL